MKLPAIGTSIHPTVAADVLLMGSQSVRGLLALSVSARRVAFVHVPDDCRRVLRVRIHADLATRLPGWCLGLPAPHVLGALLAPARTEQNCGALKR